MKHSLPTLYTRTAAAGRGGEAGRQDPRLELDDIETQLRGSESTRKGRRSEPRCPTAQPPAETLPEQASAVLKNT
eukprot:2922029-Rhodomonas_salina.3